MSHERSSHSLSDFVPPKDGVLSESTDLQSLLAAIVGEQAPPEDRVSARDDLDAEMADFAADQQLPDPDMPLERPIEAHVADFAADFDLPSLRHEQKQTQSDIAVREAVVSAAIAAAATRSIRPDLEEAERSRRMRRMLLLTGAAVLSGVVLAGLSAIAGRDDGSASPPAGTDAPADATTGAESPAPSPEGQPSTEPAGAPGPPASSTDERAEVNPRPTTARGSATPRQVPRSPARGSAMFSTPLPGAAVAPPFPTTLGGSPAPPAPPAPDATTARATPATSPSAAETAPVVPSPPEPTAARETREVNEPPVDRARAVPDPSAPPASPPVAVAPRPETSAPPAGTGAEIPPSTPPAAAAASASPTSGSTSGVIPRREPRLLERKAPEYSGPARAARISGTVEVRFTIDSAGRPTNVEATSGPRPLRGAAESAVRQWRYEPAVENGVPVSTDTTVRFSFGLTPRQPQ